MKRHLKLAAGICAVGLALPQIGAAQGFEGGDVTLSYSFLTDDTSLDQFSIDGSAEYAISSIFSVQVDLGYRAYDEATGDNLGAIALHGITDVSPNLSLGAFVSYEYSESDENETLLGLEAIYETDQFSLEGYVADFSSDVAEIGYGVTAEYMFSSYLGFGLHYDRVNLDGGDDLDSVALRGTFGPDSGNQFYAEVGQVSAGGASETFVGIGTTFNFGGSGATFSRRSALDAFGL